MDREEIVSAFRQVLDEAKIAYKVNTAVRPGSIVISFGMKCTGEIDRAWTLFEFKGTGMRLYGIAPNLAETKHPAEMYKLLAMANRDMVAGCFELASGQVRFRYFTDCTDFATVPRDFIVDTLLLPFKMFDRYGDAFVALDQGFPDASIAFGMARKGDGD